MNSEVTDEERWIVTIAAVFTAVALPAVVSTQAGKIEAGKKVYAREVLDVTARRRQQDGAAAGGVGSKHTARDQGVITDLIH